MGLLMAVLALLGLCLSLLVAYFLTTVIKSQQYWKNNKIFTLKKSTFLLGHFGPLITRKKSFAELVYDLYNEVKEEGVDFGGIYQFKRRSLVVNNPELFSEIMIKRFEHFINRRPFVDQETDKLLGRSLLGLQNEEWRDMRHNLSPAFTGSKLRGMIDLIESTCVKFNEFLAHRPDKDEPLDIYNAFRRLAADIIATSAFGSPSDAVSNPESEFYKNGIEIMNFSGKRAPIIIGYLMAPPLMKFLRIPFLPANIAEFFSKRIAGIINYREKENKSRPDMVQLLIDARKADPTKKITDMDIASQAFTFFLGGFDTTATAFSFISHELARHPEIQSKVRDEIRKVMAENGGKVNYDGTKELKYMDMVISEVLRLHPAAPMSDRMCESNCSFPDFDLTIEKGTSIALPIYGLHTDPDYFPDPFKFDPERFNDENKKNIKPFTYLPFGEGPRNCIGKRFALLELKLGLCKILNEFELEVCEKTNVTNPMQYNRKTTLMQPEGGFWLKIRPVNKE
ncbi:cytochrome P450 9e2-like [Neocloeon triangulifer]|uniref:cytochrome P450 9e2-like n=1 Tax=Neocloeon triangulifer TaxID=2078957 RepID=UPI00286EB703|nr:cytochrome P450 9e2-like [Neocloeon triangulifer]XP_059482606.1 cytochrome P450 9e2-like [Neocloeon triangulifer]